MTDRIIRPTPLFRRQFITRTLASGAVLGCSAAGHTRDEPAAAPKPSETPNPSVCTVTEANIEGPFFTPGAPDIGAEDTPHRGRLGDPQRNAAFELSGVVMGTDCAARRNARVEIWHADGAGAYDNEGFRHRGTLHTNEEGRFELSTIVPGHYRVGEGFRPAHIHVKVHVPGRALLTTQLYFQGDPYNEGDPFIRPSLIMPVQRDGGVARARFSFVV